MSTSEQFTLEAGKCPCGGGVVLQHVDSPDNPWSRVTSFYEVACPKCRLEWKACNGYLSSFGDEARRDAAFNALMEAEQRLMSSARPALDRHLDGLASKSMAAEHRYLQSKLVMRENLRDYRKRRNSGETPAEICRPLNNPQWLLDLANEGEEKELLAKTLAEAQDAKQRYHEALAVRTFHFNR